jgi:hypothetical protein
MFQNKNFTTRNKTVTPFNPSTQSFDKTYSILLNSADRIAGSTAEATFKVDLPDNFQTNNLEIELHSFLVKNPVGCSNSIINVEMSGVQNPFSYSSTNKGTHQILGSFNVMNAVQEYPPSAMNSNSTTLSNQVYGNGQYISSVTSLSSGQAYNIFDKAYHNYTTTFAFNASNSYSSNLGSYTGTASNNTVMSGQTFYGEYATIQLPIPIVLSSYKITSGLEYNIRMINSGAVAGSTDGITWKLLDTPSNVTWATSNEIKTFNVTSNVTPYSYYRLLATKVGNNDQNNYRNGFTVIEWRLLGYQTQAPNVLQSISSCVDNSLFKRPVTLKLTSPTGVDLQNISDYTAHLIVYDRSA